MNCQNDTTYCSNHFELFKMMHIHFSTVNVPCGATPRKGVARAVAGHDVEPRGPSKASGPPLRCEGGGPEQPRTGTLFFPKGSSKLVKYYCCNIYPFFKRRTLCAKLLPQSAKLSPMQHKYEQAATYKAIFSRQFPRPFPLPCSQPCPPRHSPCRCLTEASAAPENRLRTNTARRLTSRCPSSSCSGARAWGRAVSLTQGEGEGVGSGVDRRRHRKFRKVRPRLYRRQILKRKSKKLDIILKNFKVDELNLL